MITLDQVLLLEQRVESAVMKIKQLQEENDALRNECSKLKNALNLQSEQLSSLKGDQNQIENGIKKALDQLASLENSILKESLNSISNSSSSIINNTNISATSSNSFTNTDTEVNTEANAVDNREYNIADNIKDNITVNTDNKNESTDQFSNTVSVNNSSDLNNTNTVTPVQQVQLEKENNTATEPKTEQNPVSGITSTNNSVSFSSESDFIHNETPHYEINTNTYTNNNLNIGSQFNSINAPETESNPFNNARQVPAFDDMPAVPQQSNSNTEPKKQILSESEKQLNEALNPFNFEQDNDYMQAQSDPDSDPDDDENSDELGFDIF